jgi:hypothetical protein
MEKPTSDLYKLDRNRSENIIHQLRSLILHGGDEMSIGVKQDRDGVTQHLPKILAGDPSHDPSGNSV